MEVGARAPRGQCEVRPEACEHVFSQDVPAGPALGGAMSPPRGLLPVGWAAAKGVACHHGDWRVAAGARLPGEEGLGRTERPGGPRPPLPGRPEGGRSLGLRSQRAPGGHTPSICPVAGGCGRPTEGLPWLLRLRPFDPPSLPPVSPRGCRNLCLTSHRPPQPGTLASRLTGRDPQPVAPTAPQPSPDPVPGPRPAGTAAAAPPSPSRRPLCPSPLPAVCMSSASLLTGVWAAQCLFWELGGRGGSP